MEKRDVPDEKSVFWPWKWGQRNKLSILYGFVYSDIHLFTFHS